MKSVEPEFFLVARPSLDYDAVAAYTEMLEANPKDTKAHHNRAAIYEQLPQTEDAAKKDLAADN